MIVCFFVIACALPPKEKKKLSAFPEVRLPFFIRRFKLRFKDRLSGGFAQKVSIEC